MYEGIRKERQLRMSSLSRQQAPNTLNSQSRTITLFAISLFALAGLISGLSVGAFVRPNLALPALNSNSPATPPITSEPQKATRTPHAQHFGKLGWPVFSQYSTIEMADDHTTYTLTAYAVDQSIDSAHGNPVHTSGITFKLWLVQRIPTSTTFMLAISDLKNIGTIQNPLTGSVQGQPYGEISGLNFDAATQQTHASNAKGRATWKYQLSPSVAPGDYDLVVLTDWDGKYYNWSWENIEIKQ